MTQSGQGEEPSARPAREGIVLPSDGGQPLLPGTAGGQGGPAPVPPAGQPPAPAEGRAWGQPWGPDGRQASPASPGQGWGAPSEQSWDPGAQQHQPPQSSWDGYGAAQSAPPGALPPEGAPAPQQAAPNPYAMGGYGAPLPPAASDGHGYGAPSGHGPAYGAPAASSGYGGPADEGATQYLPPVPAAPADEGATQYIPPVTSGTAPPEASGDPGTHYLGHFPQGGHGPLPSGGDPDAEATRYIPPMDAAAPYGAAAAGERQPPAEFDNLFRSDADAASSTRQFPPVQQPHGAGPGWPGTPGPGVPGPGGPGGGAFDGRGDDGDGGRGRGGSRVPLIAAVGVGIIALGVGAGALLSGGGDSDDTGKKASVSATAPTAGSSASPGGDAARAQAVELDKLLADSGGSRTSVINAVANVKKCADLGKAGDDLRAAGGKRGELVTRLGGLAVDKLPAHAELTAALTSAWKASESADRHYAAWADQTGAAKGCHKGHARVTGEVQQGNRQSGVASAQKAKAAQLWNTIARTYGLTERQPTQL
ncbi:hypothetical protein [Streptomyces sp. NPDC046985]|uniref:hypothetical protein n=1 Tax=Streptomyces sp. NPDC046985 TaxID=3155377 RepID=UPI0033D3A0D6